MFRLVILLLFIPFLLSAQTQAGGVSQLFENLKANPMGLRLFLLNMPKGGELHYHWDGSTYPENMAYDLRNSNFCYNSALLGVQSDNKFCSDKDQLNNIASNPSLYQTLINNWSLTSNYSNRVKTNDHFFQFFIGTEPVVEQYSGQMLADEIQRAGTQHEDYMEMVTILDLPKMILLGSQISEQNNLEKMYQAVQATNTTSMVNSISQSIKMDYTQAQHLMRCGTAHATVGCVVKTRFLLSAMRNFPPSTVFTQLVIAFEVAKVNPLVLGVDLVGPENDYNADHDYTLQMQMIHFLHKLYPSVHVRLHAGELSLEEAAPNFMRTHVEQAINIAGAQRIGHGVDIGYETNGIRTLKEMARKHICVETLLTSNEKLLDIKGPTQPLPLYLHYHVPVVLSTDDEGILRTTLTNEFYKAVTRYNLTYAQIKKMARNVPTYSFLPGKNLWANLDDFTPVKFCKGQPLGAAHPTGDCAIFLAHSEKARLQWKLESQLKTFEAHIVNKMAA